MYGSLKRTILVARLTAKEGLRRSSFFVVTLGAAAVTAFSPWFAFFHLGEEAKLVVDLGLSTMTAASALLAILTAGAAVAEEIEGRAALTMLSKPLGRTEYIVGKFLGVAGTSAASVFVVAVVLAAALRWETEPIASASHFHAAAEAAGGTGILFFSVSLALYLWRGRGWGPAASFWLGFFSGVVVLFAAAPSNGGPGWDLRLWDGAFCIALHAAVISACAVLFAVRLSLVQTALCTTALFVVGHASGAWLRGMKDTVHGTVLRALIPDLSLFNLADALAVGHLESPTPIPWDVLAGTSLYALLYGGAILAGATLLFTHRDLG